MKTKTLFSADNLNTENENLSRHSTSVFFWLLQIFTTVSFVVLGLYVVTLFWEPETDTLRNIFNIVVFITFMLLLIVKKNLGRWHFGLLLTFTISFSGFSYLLLGSACLAFTLPSAAMFGIVTLISSIQEKPLSFKTCWMVMLAFVPLTYGVIYWIVDDGALIATLAASQLLLFVVIMLLMLKPLLKKKYPECKKYSTAELASALVILHAGLSNLSLLASIAIWLMTAF